MGCLTSKNIPESQPMLNKADKAIVDIGTTVSYDMGAKSDERADSFKKKLEDKDAARAARVAARAACVAARAARVVSPAACRDL